LLVLRIWQQLSAVFVFNEFYDCTQGDSFDFLQASIFFLDCHFVDVLCRYILKVLNDSFSFMNPDRVMVRALAAAGARAFIPRCPVMLAASAFA
jgi:hypothetical protein